MSSSSLFLVVKTPVLLADFVRRADRRGTSERTSGGKAVTGATGSILHSPFSVKSIFGFFLGPHPCFIGFTPEFRLFSRTGRNSQILPAQSPRRTTFAFTAHLRHTRCCPQQRLCRAQHCFSAQLGKISTQPLRISSRRRHLRYTTPSSPGDIHADARRCLEPSLRIHAI
jgi:hypothetical protein